MHKSEDGIHLVLGAVVRVESVGVGRGALGAGRHGGVAPGLGRSEGHVGEHHVCRAFAIARGNASERSNKSCSRWLLGKRREELTGLLGEQVVAAVRAVDKLGEVADVLPKAHDDQSSA